MQFEEGPPGTRVPLPRPSIDTGMGLERVAAILQGKHDNYDIDIFRALILASAEVTGQDPDGPFKTSHRVIADHLRSTSFLMADGVLPSNEGRGYVLRRIMRRAMRHATMMGAKEPLMYRLVPALIRQMGAAYPELGRAETLIDGNAAAGGNPLQAPAGTRPAPAGRGNRPPRRQASPARPGRVPPVRHVRLPARPHAGRSARTGPRRRSGRVRGRHAGTAHPRPRRLGRFR